MQNQDESLRDETRTSVLNLALAFFTTVQNFVSQVLNPKNDRARAQSNALFAFSIRVASAAMLYLMQIVLARWMGSFEYGIYVFVWTWVLILGGLAPLGLNIAAIRLVPEYAEQGQPSKLRGLIFGTRLTAFVAGIVITGLGFLGLYLFSPYISSYYVLPVYLALVCIPLYAIGDMQDGLGRGNAWMGVALIPPYVLRPTLILGFMLAAYAAGFPMVATTAAGAAILATWISTLIQMAVLNHKFHYAVAQIPSRESTHDEGGSKRDTSDPTQNKRQFEYRRWLTISAPLLVINACELLLQNTDVLIISQYLSPAEVGIYFAAAKTMSLIMFVHYAVGSAVANQFSALKARGDHEGLQAYVGDALNWTFWPSLAAAIILLLIGKPLLSLFGPQFAAEGYPVMFILAVGFLLRSAVGPAEFLMNMLGQQRLCAIVLVCTAILNIILNLVLVPTLGLTGAAYATATSLSVGALANYFAVRHCLGIDLAIWKNMNWR